MENASKALLMAGGVLISIIIISMLVLMGNSLTSYQQTSVQTQRETNIFNFNQQYEGYNRQGVRGNELYSLISKSIDYNYRESSLITTTEQFEPMTIVFNLKDADLTKDGKKRIFTLGKNKDYTFTKSSYSESLRANTIQKIYELTSKQIQGSNNTELLNQGKIFKFTEASLDRLVTGYDKIFVDNEEFKNRKVTDKVQIFTNFNSALGEDFFVIPTITVGNNKGQIDENKLNDLWELLNDNSDPIKEAVNTYFEYIQFKRAIFDCETNSVKYSNTGRIVYMKFNFTGKFN